MATKVGVELARARKGKDLTQKQLAKKMQIRSGGQTISGIERGVVKPRPKYLKKLARVLGLEKTFFMKAAVEDMKTEFKEG